MGNNDDMALVDRVLAKDRVAFEEFFTLYFSRLCRFAKTRMHEESSVEDVVQDTLIKALKGLHNYRGEAQLFSWLCQICRNEVSNWYKKHGRKQQQLVSWEDDPNIQALLDSLGESKNLDDSFAISRLVQLTLDHLPDKYGKVLEWKYLEGLSVEEIANHLGIGKLATQSMLARARTAFRNAIRDIQGELGVSH